MASPNLPAGGGCRCDRIRFEITVSPLVTMACHCRGCQRMTASAYSLSMAVAADGFAVIQGDPAIGGLHGATRHYFCSWCMSWLFTRPEGFDGFVNVRATMLDDPSWFTPFIETWTSSKLPWAVTHAVHSFETIPSMAEFGMLCEAFARDALG